MSQFTPLQLSRVEYPGRHLQSMAHIEPGFASAFTSQAMQDAFDTAPVIVEYVPAGQSLQPVLDVAIAFSEYFPGMHDKQTRRGGLTHTQA